MGPAAQERLIRAGLRQYRAGALDVGGLALVGSTAQRELGLREAEALRDSFLDEWKCLHRLGRRPMEGLNPGVADRRQNGTVGVRHHRMHAVSGLDRTSADDFDVVHLQLP